MFSQFGKSVKITALVHAVTSQLRVRRRHEISVRRRSRAHHEVAGRDNC